MSVCKDLFLLWMFSLLSRTGSGYDYEDYSDPFYNDITEEQQRASPCPCDGGERLRWEKIFIMMEDSHMMQKILLQVNEELKMEISTLRNQIQKISSDISTSCLRVVEETCRSMNEQQNLEVERNTTRRQRDVEQGVHVQKVEGLEEMKEVEEVEEGEEIKVMMELGKTEKIKEKDKWWTKWRFWR
ncbi:uncharacterized protein Hap1MRO34_007725 isoform 2-T2 [Clarias gariepinus]|uniref:pentraxin-related protein PTX3-like isoform X2 n=1 Tax=Clarias gariepinus TaxID=13013 RepID=UPI00234D5B2B|nr:pentraxin-related protein PTX3-like isoform X2 [Clarias gariepinus]